METNGSKWGDELTEPDHLATASRPATAECAERTGARGARGNRIARVGKGNRIACARVCESRSARSARSAQDSERRAGRRSGGGETKSRASQTLP